MANIWGPPLGDFITAKKKKNYGLKKKIEKHVTMYGTKTYTQTNSASTGKRAQTPRKYSTTWYIIITET